MFRTCSGSCLSVKARDVASGSFLSNCVVFRDVA